MDDKLPNDKLEDFLKKSFEDYTESPPDDLWDKIEGGLGAAPVVKPFFFRGWWIAAAAAVVVGIFVAQHFYFENKIERLTKELKQNKVELQESETEKPTGNNFQTQNLENESDTPRESIPQASSGPALKPSGGQEFFDKKLPATAGKSTVSNGNFSTKKTNKQTEIASENIDNEVVSSLKSNEASPSTRQMETVVTDVPNLVSNPVSSETLTLAAPSLLEVLNAKVQTEQITTPKPNLYPAPTDPLRQTRLTTGVRVMPMATWERINEVRPAMFPNRPGRPEKFFNNQQQVSGQVLAAGATLEYELDDRLSLVSGLDYFRTETTSRHRSEFMFKERKMPMPGNPANRHDFNYNLNTSSGLVEVDVRVEATNPSLPVPDNEILAFEVKTDKTMTSLSVPLALKYSIGRGRLHGYLKGGIAANFLLNQSFNISEIRSLNNRFRVSPVRPMRGQPQNLRTVSMSYLAAAGVEYDLTRSLSVNLEPTFMGSLSSQHSANFIRSNNYMAGVSAGLSYVF